MMSMSRLGCQRVLGVSSGLALGLILWSGGPALAASGACSKTAASAFKACRSSIGDDYWTALGNCENTADATEQATCKDDARSARRDATDECKAQLDARKEVCAEVGEDPYDPQIDTLNFVGERGLNNDRRQNPLFPLVPRTYCYSSNLEDDQVNVTDQVKEILGVTVRVIHDVVTDKTGDVPFVSEDTEDWYGLDRQGNVWYFGESSKQLDESGEIIGLEGSWTAGEDDAKPGIIMEAAPQTDDFYRQEFALGIAEDVAKVLSTDASADVPASGASCDGTCLETEDTSPLEPDVVENKFYSAGGGAPGIGDIQEVDQSTGEVLSLIKIVDLNEDPTACQ
jgi:hypothetical protein